MKLPLRTRTWKDKHSLSIHVVVAETPEEQPLVVRLVADWTSRIAAGEDPHGLIRETIKINAADEIGDGRHRVLAALRVPQIAQVECETLADGEFADLIIEMLLQRRHYTKSARAYALKHMAAEAAKAGSAARGGNLKKGQETPETRLNRLSGKKAPEVTLESLALKAGLSTDLLGQAVKLESFYMPKADQLIDAWLAINPDEEAAWLAWQETHPYAGMPWTAWRMARLAELGVPDNAASVNVIPRNLREIEEDKIFNGCHDPLGEDCDRLSYSLGSSLKAMGSYFNTAGKPRSDLDQNHPALHLVVANKVRSFSTTAWANWSQIDAVGRLEVIQRLTLSISGGTDEQGRPVDPWPEDVRRAMLVTLSGKGGAK